MLMLSVLCVTLTAIPNTGHVFSCIVPLSHGILFLSEFQLFSYDPDHGGLVPQVKSG